MLHAKEDLLPSLVIPHVVQVLTLLLDDVLDPTSLLDKGHEVLVWDDSGEGLWLGVVHNGIDIQVSLWTGPSKSLPVLSLHCIVVRKVIHSGPIAGPVSLEPIVGASLLRSDLDQIMHFIVSGVYFFVHVDNLPESLRTGQ